MSGCAGVLVGVALLIGGLVTAANNVLIGVFVIALGLAMLWAAFSSGRNQVQRNDDGDRVPCPLCSELIKPTALKCRFCQSDLSEYNR